MIGDGAGRRTAVALMLGTVIAGCGGSSHRSSTSKAGDQAAKAPTADESAFVEIARASGSLRGAAAPVAVGKAARLGGRTSMQSARRLVATIRPKDAKLAQLKSQIIDALRAALAARADASSQRRAAKTAMVATDAINRSLRKYAQHHPGLAQLIPD
jgi:hypothetical protein